MKFSREQELDADKKGLELYLKSAYDPEEAARALLMLEVSNEEEEGESVSYSLDLIDIFDVYQSDLCGKDFDYAKAGWDWKVEEKEELAESEEVLTEEEQKKLRTHPSIEERIKTLQNLLGNHQSSDSITFIEPKADFFRMRQICFFELVEKYHQQSRYGRSLYLCLIMQERWPENEYLHILSCKNVYWIAYYHHNQSITKVVDNPFLYGHSAYGEFLCFLSRLAYPDMKRFSQGYLTKEKKKFNNQEDIAFFHAEITDLFKLFLTSKDSKSLYEQYLLDFPSGKYQYFVERKLGQRK